MIELKSGCVKIKDVNIKILERRIKNVLKMN